MCHLDTMCHCNFVCVCSRGRREKRGSRWSKLWERSCVWRRLAWCCSRSSDRVRCRRRTWCRRSVLLLTPHFHSPAQTQSVQQCKALEYSVVESVKYIYSSALSLLEYFCFLLLYTTITVTTTTALLYSRGKYCSCYCTTCIWQAQSLLTLQIQFINAKYNQLTHDDVLL